jgi:hypothetical protein
MMEHEELTLEQVTQAVNRARSTLRNADAEVRRMADLLVGRLRAAGISNYTLARLKRELRDFNSHTKHWKE